MSDDVPVKSIIRWLESVHVLSDLQLKESQIYSDCFDLIFSDRKNIQHRVIVNKDGSIREYQIVGASHPQVAQPQPVSPLPENAIGELRFSNDLVLNIKDAVTIGRENFKNELDAKSLAQLSNFHLNISKKDNGYFITDGYESKRSTNGTFVNMTDIRESGPVLLKDGDVINLANVVEGTFSIITKPSTTTQMTEMAIEEVKIPSGRQQVIMRSMSSSKSIIAVDGVEGDSRTYIQTSQTLPPPQEAAIAELRFSNNLVFNIKVSLVIGRDNFKNDMDPKYITLLSGRHLNIVKNDDGFFISDGCEGKKSTNGTFVNSIDIRNSGPVQLKTGDLINLANVIEGKFSIIGKPTKLAEPMISPSLKKYDAVKVPKTKQILLLITPSGKRMEISEGRVIGRNDFSNELPPDKSIQISSRHFEVIQENGKWCISDGFQGKLSMNGTKVNGVSLNMSEKIELNPGDQIVLGGLLKLNVKFE